MNTAPAPVLEPAAPPAIVALPRVETVDIYAALVADSRRPTTRRGREQDIAALARHVGVRGPAETCSLLLAGDAAAANATLSSFVTAMLGRRLAPATIARRVSTVRRLFKLARRYSLIDWTIDVDTPHVVAYRDTAGPGRAGWLRILEHATAAADRSTKGKRDLAVVRLIHDQGLRRAEVGELDLVDWEPDSGRLWVRGKGKSDKSPIRLNRPTIAALVAWLEVRPATNSPALFVRFDRSAGNNPGRLDDRTLLLIVRELARKAGLRCRVGCHSLRHEAVTRILELTNGNIDAAQKFARHADPKTTQRYNDNRRDVAGEMARLLGDDQAELE
jgi:integrase/recombinase XerC